MLDNLLKPQLNSAPCCCDWGSPRSFIPHGILKIVKEHTLIDQISLSTSTSWVGRS